MITLTAWILLLRSVVIRVHKFGFKIIVVFLQYGASLLHLAAKVGSQKCLLSLLAAGRGKVVVADEVSFVNVLVVCSHLSDMC